MAVGNKIICHACQITEQNPGMFIFWNLCHTLLGNYLVVICFLDLERLIVKMI